MADQATVFMARIIAFNAHANQKYGVRPYTVHLEHVVQVLQRFGVDDPALLAAGWLHDALEDTALPLIVIEGVDARVAELVKAVTDGPGATRAERKRHSYDAIPRVAGALTIKLADRIANVEACYATRDTGRLSIYRREHVSFVEALYGSRDLNDVDDRMASYLAQVI